MEQQYLAYVDSKFGCFELKASYLGLSSLKLVANKGESTPNPPSYLLDYSQQLDDYFAGKLQSFDIPLDWDGQTAFNISVWKALLKVPYGHTTSYSALAYQLDNPKAVRAVGLANRNNPIAIVVPCHRVLAKNGDLQGYFYGLDMKRSLLQLENPMSFGSQGTLF